MLVAAVILKAFTHEKKALTIILFHATHTRKAAEFFFGILRFHKISMRIQTKLFERSHVVDLTLNALPPRFFYININLTKWRQLLSRKLFFFSLTQSSLLHFDKRVIHWGNMSSVLAYCVNVFAIFIFCATCGFLCTRINI